MPIKLAGGGLRVADRRRCPLSHELWQDGELYAELSRIDHAWTQQAQAEGCLFCGAALDRADYPRKVRGLPAGAEAEHARRLSLCCRREGCRRRCTPPSVRFFGRRVYASTLVVLVAVWAQRGGAPASSPSVPRRTRRRWTQWWPTAFVVSALWQAQGPSLMPPPALSELPSSLLGRFVGSPREQLVALLRWLSPLSRRPPPGHAF